MKASKRIVALMLSVCMAVGSMGMQVQAYGGDGRQTELPELAGEALGEDAAGDTAAPGSTEGTKEDLEEAPDTAGDSSNVEGTKEDLGETPDTAGNSGNKEGTKEDLEEAPDTAGDSSNVEGTKEEPEESPSPAEARIASGGQGKEEQPEKGRLNFIMQEMEELGIPGVQNVAASLGEDGIPVERAALEYHNDAGQEFTAEAAGLAGNMVRFSMEYTQEGQAGIYRLDRVSWKQGGKQYQADLAELGMEIVYGVNQQVQAEPDEVLLDEGLLEEVEANVVTLDENGVPVSESTLESVLEEAGGQKARAQGGMARGAANKMVIVLSLIHISEPTRPY